MADERRRRMSRHIRLVLLGGLPGLLGCGGCGGDTRPAGPPADEVVEVEEVEEVPPPTGPAHLIGAPFVGWWAATRPPLITRRLVPRSAVNTGTGTRTGGSYRRGFYGGRSGYLHRGGAVSPAPRSSGVVRGGFGSSGRAAGAGA